MPCLSAATTTDIEQLSPLGVLLIHERVLYFLSKSTVLNVAPKQLKISIKWEVAYGKMSDTNDDRK